MKALGICARGLAKAVELLIHPSAITPAEIMDLFWKLGTLYEELYCRMSVTSLAKVFKDHLSAHFARLRRYALQLDKDLPPRVSVITPKLQLTLDQLSESTRQRVSQHIVPENEKGRTGSRYKGESRVDMLGKHSALGKAIKALNDSRFAEDSASSDEELKTKRPRRNSNCGGRGGGGGGGNGNGIGGVIGGGGSGTGRGNYNGSDPNGGGTQYPPTGPSKAQCFLWGKKDHLRTTCKVPRNRWIDLEKLPVENQHAARQVRGIIKIEPETI